MMRKLNSSAQLVIGSNFSNDRFNREVKFDNPVPETIKELDTPAPNIQNVDDGTSQYSGVTGRLKLNKNKTMGIANADEESRNMRKLKKGNSMYSQGGKELEQLDIAEDDVHN